MIISGLFTLIIQLLDIIFAWVSFPPMPAVVVTSLDFLFEHLENAMSIVWFFVPAGLVKTLLPIVLLIKNFDNVYSIVMWVLKKIPFLGME